MNEFVCQRKLEHPIPPPMPPANCSGCEEFRNCFDEWKDYKALFLDNSSSTTLSPATQASTDNVITMSPPVTGASIDSKPEDLAGWRIVVIVVFLLRVFVVLLYVVYKYKRKQPVLPCWKPGLACSALPMQKYEEVNYLDNKARNNETWGGHNESKKNSNPEDSLIFSGKTDTSDIIAGSVENCDILNFRNNGVDVQMKDGSNKSLNEHNYTALSPDEKSEDGDSCAPLIGGYNCIDRGQSQMMSKSTPNPTISEELDTNNETEEELEGPVTMRQTGYGQDKWTISAKDKKETGTTKDKNITERGDESKDRRSDRVSGGSTDSGKKAKKKKLGILKRISADSKVGCYDDEDEMVDYNQRKSV